MKTYPLLESFKEAQAELEQKQVDILFNRLAELFKSIQKIQPKITSMVCGMGTWCFCGETLVEYYDGYWDGNEHEIIKELGIDESDGSRMCLYKGYIDTRYHDHIELYLKPQREDKWDVHTTYYINEEAIEFYHLCEYMVEYNLTTYFNGIDENGIIK